MIFNVKLASLAALLALGTAVLAAPAPCDEPTGAPGLGVGVSIGLGGGDGSGHHHTTAPAAASPSAAPGTPAAPGGASPTSAATSAAATSAATPAGATGAASPTGAPGAPGASAGSCNTGTIQCCNSVQPASSLSAAQLAKAGLLGVVLQDLNIPVGLDCDPINVVGLGGNSCTAMPVCCENNSQNGLVNLGCVPLNLSL